jgi:hypothetical protein
MSHRLNQVFIENSRFLEPITSIRRAQITKLLFVMKLNNEAAEYDRPRTHGGRVWLATSHAETPGTVPRLPIVRRQSIRHCPDGR